MVENQRPREPCRRARSGRTGALSLFDPKVQKALLALHSAMESQAFLKSAVRLLHAAIPCDVVFTLLNYSIDQGRSPVVWGSDGSTFSEEYLRDSLVGNPHRYILAANPGLKVWRLSDCYASEAAMEDCPFFIRFIQRIGMRHAVALFFWNETLDAANFTLAPNRGPREADISAAEMAAVEALHPHIDAAYRRVNRLQSATGLRRGLEDFVSTLPLAIILLDWQLAPLYHNAAAREAVAHWSGAHPHLKLTHREFKIPADLHAILVEIRTERTQPPRRDPGLATFRERTVVHSSLPGFQAVLSMTALRSPHFGKPSFVIRFEANGTSQGGKLAVLTHLSPRERELALMVREGQSNQEIADTLGRQLNTVKSELHSIFKKLQIPSRARLNALLR
jgi:DNA-binding CsgD family transcriptional regulator